MDATEIMSCTTSLLLRLPSEERYRTKLPHHMLFVLILKRTCRSTLRKLVPCFLPDVSLCLCRRGPCVSSRCRKLCRRSYMVASAAGDGSLARAVDAGRSRRSSARALYKIRREARSDCVFSHPGCLVAMPGQLAYKIVIDIADLFM